MKNKNIHILPTDKSSILGFDSVKNLHFVNDFIDDYQNIYITSDEEIKEEDWFISSGLIYKVNRNVNLINPNKDKKIILTTDTDLIKDGVQETPDEFLEWFVKNPSCEFVKTQYHYETICDEGDYTINPAYWTIIIPKEEPKQETLEEAALKYASEKLRRVIIPYKEFNANVAEYVGFVNGAKWQQEQDLSMVQGYLSANLQNIELLKRSYSEEEVHKILGSYSAHKEIFSHKYTYDMWFEQFKKK